MMVKLKGLAIATLAEFDVLCNITILFILPEHFYNQPMNIKQLGHKSSNNAKY
jgi:hypothetical protein